MTAIFPRPHDRIARVRDFESLVPVARLASLSETLAAQPIGPSASFRAELRARLLAEHAAGAATPGADEAGPAPVRLLAPPHRHPAVRGAAAGIALVLAGGGVAAAAAGDSLPGDTLHPLKRFTESVRNAVDPHRDQPSHVLREIDVRLSELQRSSRPALGATPRGVAPERWPAMVTTLSDITSELERLAPRAADPTVRAALVERRQRLADILPTLTSQQQPPVQQLIATIDTITGTPAAGGLLSVPAPAVRAPALAVAGGIDDVLAALRTDPAAAGSTTHSTASSGTRATSHRSTSSAGTGRNSTTAPAPGTRSRAVSTSAPSPGSASTGSVSTGSVSTGSVSARTSRAIAGTAPRNAARTAPMVRTVTVTVTTVTTRITRTTRTTDGVATTWVGPTTRTVTTTTAGVLGAAAGRTVSTTTRTVVTSTGGATLPTEPLTSARLPGVLRTS